MVSTALPQPGASPPTFCHGNNLAQRQRDRRAAGRAPGCPKRRRARTGGSRVPQQPALSSDTQVPHAKSPHRVPINPHPRKGGGTGGTTLKGGTTGGDHAHPQLHGRHRIRVRVRCGRRGAGRQNALHKRPQACAAGVRPLMAPPRSAQPRELPSKACLACTGLQCLCGLRRVRARPCEAASDRERERAQARRKQRRAGQRPRADDQSLVPKCMPPCLARAVAPAAAAGAGPHLPRAAPAPAAALPGTACAAPRARPVPARRRAHRPLRPRRRQRSPARPPPGPGRPRRRRPRRRPPPRPL